MKSNYNTFVTNGIEKCCDLKVAYCSDFFTSVSDTVMLAGILLAIKSVEIETGGEWVVIPAKDWFSNGSILTISTGEIESSQFSIRITNECSTVVHTVRTAEVKCNCPDNPTAPQIGSKSPFGYGELIGHKFEVNGKKMEWKGRLPWTSLWRQWETNDESVFFHGLGKDEHDLTGNMYIGVRKTAEYRIIVNDLFDTTNPIGRAWATINVNDVAIYNHPVVVKAGVNINIILDLDVDDRVSVNYTNMEQTNQTIISYPKRDSILKKNGIYGGYFRIETT